MSKIYKGIDISLYQGFPDFEKVKKAGIDFVMLKASQGKTNIYPYPFKDPNFDKNIVNFSRTRGKIYAGSYHLMTGQTEKDVIEEAELYIKTIKP